MLHLFHLAFKTTTTTTTTQHWRQCNDATTTRLCSMHVVPINVLEEKALQATLE